MLQRAPNGFGSAERGRTRHRQGALATQDGRAERAKLGRPAGSPEQAWPGLRIAIPTPPRFQQISPVQQSTFGHPVDHAPAGQVSRSPGPRISLRILSLKALVTLPRALSQTTRTGAEVIDGAYGSYHNHLAPAPVDSHRPGVQPGFSPAARVTPFSEPLDSRFGSVDPSFYHHPPTPFLGLPTSPLSPFLPVHWPAYGSLPASPGVSGLARLHCARLLTFPFSSSLGRFGHTVLLGRSPASAPAKTRPAGFRSRRRLTPRQMRARRRLGRATCPSCSDCLPCWAGSSSRRGGRRLRSAARRRTGGSCTPASCPCRLRRRSGRMAAASRRRGITAAIASPSRPSLLSPARLRRRMTGGRRRTVTSTISHQRCPLLLRPWTLSSAIFCTSSNRTSDA